MQKTVHSTLSADGVLHLTCPRSWAEMTQEQLRYAFNVIGSGHWSSVEGRTLMLLRFTGIKVEHKVLDDGWECSVDVVNSKGKQSRHCFVIRNWQLQDFIGQLEYVDSYETMNVRLESIQGHEAVDAMLHGVRFHDYLQMEKYYQGYLQTQKKEYAIGLARHLYPGAEDADVAEVTCCVMWYSYVKKHLARFFPHFFRPAGHGKSVDWLEQMNAQIRALTDGDITKEQAVFDKDCWRALTELDAKSREAEELRKKYPKS